jgi:hypothetical protein
MLNTSSHVLAFDIGIRNLAWCLMNKDAGNWNILGWDNYDLISEQSTQTAKDNKKLMCSANNCKKRAQYVHADMPPTCAKCCNVSFPPLKDLSGVPYKSIPSLKVLKEITAQFMLKKKDKKSLIEFLEKKYSLPIVPVKATKSKTEDLVSIHKSIQRFVDNNNELFERATHILLENQPAFKNPTMKSVQILLFATLRDRLQGERYVGFVHAGKKGGSSKSETGDKGYVTRKKASEDRVKNFFETTNINEKEKWMNVLQINQKKSDLSDAMCMCIDRVNTG